MTSTPDPVLPLSLPKESRARFSALFYEPETLKIQAKTNLHIHILHVQNGDFDLTRLYRELGNNSIAYVLSRLHYEQAMSDPTRIVQVVNKVQAQFRKPDEKAGEGGEVILYSLLEGHLGAPKVLSKMEIKTSSQHYVHGSDGVHLLRTGDNSYQLVFGESKMYGDGKNTPGSSAKLGIKAAFKSIDESREEGLKFDTWLVESELLKEKLDAEGVEALAAILLPSTAGPGSGIKKVHGFGIFVGYEIDVTDVQFEDLELDAAEALLCQRATDTIRAEQDTIKGEISSRGLGGYPFHIYAIPFTKRRVKSGVRGIHKVREELAAELGRNKGAAP